MKKMILGILILGLVLSWSCTYSNYGKFYSPIVKRAGDKFNVIQISDFPEEIIYDSTLTGWEFYQTLFISDVFQEGVSNSVLHQGQKGLTVGSIPCRYARDTEELYVEFYCGSVLLVAFPCYYGRKTGKPVVVVAVKDKHNFIEVPICAYYVEELIKIVKEKYRYGWTAEEAIKVLKPEIDKTAHKILLFYYQEKQ